MSDSTKKVYERTFLNKDSGMAAIQTGVQFFNPTISYGCIEISDCRKTISLDFDYVDTDARTLQEHKLTTLINALEDFRKKHFA